VNVDTVLPIGDEKYAESGIQSLLHDGSGDGVKNGNAGGSEPMTMRLRVRQQVKDAARNCCSTKTLKRKLPILQWLPKYRSVP
jgi:hypothetical protein